MKAHRRSKETRWEAAPNLAVWLHGRGGDLQLEQGEVHFSLGWNDGEVVLSAWGVKTYLATQGEDVAEDVVVTDLASLLERGDIERTSAGLVLPRGTLPTTSTRS